MPFLVTGVAESAFPNLQAVEVAASNLGLRHTMLGEWLRGFQSGTEVRVAHGHQQVLARELESFLRAELLAQGLEECSPRVSDRLGEEVDVACARDWASERLLIEIEFRPNFEKDLVKFMIAREAGRLALAVLVVAQSRVEVNPRYTSMPEFAKVVRVVGELNPAFPLLVLGLAGKLS